MATIPPLQPPSLLDLTLDELKTKRRSKRATPTDGRGAGEELAKNPLPLLTLRDIVNRDPHSERPPKVKQFNTHLKKASNAQLYEFVLQANRVWVEGRAQPSLLGKIYPLIELQILGVQQLIERYKDSSKSEDTQELSNLIQKYLSLEYKFFPDDTIKSHPLSDLIKTAAEHEDIELLQALASHFKRVAKKPVFNLKETIEIALSHSESNPKSSIRESLQIIQRSSRSVDPE